MDQLNKTLFRKRSSVGLKVGSNESGMTLLEIMIVLVILSGLIGVLATQVTKQLGKARVKEARIQISEIGKALDMFYTDCGFYPTAEQGLKSLVEPDTSCRNWGPDAYLKNIPVDPWGSPFMYDIQGNTWILTSLGEDKREGGSGLAADISSEDAGR